jgi:hypothetical protein
MQSVDNTAIMLIVIVLRVIGHIQHNNEKGSIRRNDWVVLCSASFMLSLEDAAVVLSVIMLRVKSMVTFRIIIQNGTQQNDTELLWL